jgi:hypothetical protein
MTPELSWIFAIFEAFYKADVRFGRLSSLLLQRILAPRLTASRGDKWTKEMDYVYLTFAAVGVVWSIDRIDIVNDAIVLPSFYGPFLVAIALVIRALKTRAEIGGWNKPKPPAAPASST